MSGLLLSISRRRVLCMRPFCSPAALLSDPPFFAPCLEGFFAGGQWMHASSSQGQTLDVHSLVALFCVAGKRRLLAAIQLAGLKLSSRARIAGAEESASGVKPQHFQFSARARFRKNSPRRQMTGPLSWSSARPATATSKLKSRPACILTTWLEQQQPTLFIRRTTHSSGALSIHPNP